MEEVFDIWIATTPERLWQAVTDVDIRAEYTFGALVVCDFTPGSRFAQQHPSTGALLGEGEIVQADPPPADSCRR